MIHTIRAVLFSVGLTTSVTVVILPGMPNGLGPQGIYAAEPTLQEQGDGLMKNVEDMLAHGGMGDAKAIIHHCGEAARYAEALLMQLSPSDPRRDSAVSPLTQVIQQCKRVSDIGPHADPGQLLNPAIKARAAARESLKSLGVARTNRS